MSLEVDGGALLTNVSSGAAGNLWAMEVTYPTAASVWGSTFDECLERRGLKPMGNGDYIPHCCTGLGEHSS